MPRSKGTNRRKSTLHKVSVKPRSKKVPPTSALQHSSLDYDEKATQFANYQRLGLLADANQIGAVHDKVTGFKPRVKGPMAAARPSDAQHTLEDEMPEALLTIRRVPPGEVKVLRKLIERHGEDYAAMARDGRVNTLQHTGAHLRNRIGKLHKDDEEDQEAVAAAAARGEAAPEPRGKRKMTRDPNPAFTKKRAMHFT